MMKNRFELMSLYSFSRRIRFSSPNRPKIDPGADFDQFSKNLIFFENFEKSSGGGKVMSDVPKLPTGPPVCNTIHSLAGQSRYFVSNALFSGPHWPKGRPHETCISFRKIDMNDTGHAGLGRLESVTHQSARVLRLGQLSLPLGKLAVDSHDIELVTDIPVQPESIHIGRHHQQRYCVLLR